MVRRLIQGVIATPEKPSENAEAKTFEERLKELIPGFKEHKTKLDALKKISDKENSEIKKIMGENKLGEFAVDDIKVTYSYQDRSSFNETRLITKLKELKITGVIKKKEYVDENALEDAIFKDDTLAAKIASCMDQNLIPTLRLGKVDKKKTDEED